ncbi:hypothetical protein SCP_0504960 [Sparassis crispa]|uniref:N-acetyltransferase domain-containing protein n=1 Tax=Sparassis crispa TaxID=139825 RepID=A0A401GMJ0_9APHY|nr:hypothetical protein SCP_0504960 [Sparassis crispa]GBE83447.1 hypothetical protein SCP_0504960 [Sparassis crispa]
MDKPNPLTAESEPDVSLVFAQVKLLNYNEIPQAIETGVRACEEDSLFRYLIYDTQNADKRCRRQRYWLFYYLGIATAVHHREALTIDRGNSLVILRPAPNSRKDTLFDRTWKPVHTLVVRFLMAFDTKIQKERHAEFTRKLTITLKDTIADRIYDMMWLDGESTARDKQGLGYDFMLVGYAAGKADILGRAIWSCSYSTRRTELYEKFGFLTVGEFTVGEDNPTWDKPPVLIRVMVRQPQSFSRSNEKSQVGYTMFY